MKTKEIVKERIIERIPEGMTLQIQTLSNEIMNLNESIISTENDLHNTKQELKDKDKYTIKLQREVASLNKQIKRYQSDFNESEKKRFHTERRLEESLKIS